MRTVAITLAVLTLVASFPPASAADDCQNPGLGSFCTAFDLNRPSPPPGVPAVPPSPNWGKYYLWVGPGHCVPPDTRDCHGTPGPAPGGVHVPQVGYVGLGLFAVLYQESNGVGGLQRHQTSRLPDRIVLV